MSGYHIAVNDMVTDKLQPGDPRWATFNDSFRNQELDVLDFANAVYTGHAYTTWHKGRRKRDTFIMGQHLAPDFDTEDERSSFDTLLAHPFVSAFGSFMHSTPSHRPNKPRSRVVFLLDEPIADPVAYEAAMAFLLTMFPAADQSTKDASRFYYGAQDCQIEMLGKVLPVNVLRTYAKRWRMAHKQQMPPAMQRSDKILRMDDARAQRIEQTPSGVQVARGVNVEALLRPVRTATEGNRNHTLNTQAFLAGKDIAAGRITASEIVPLLLSAARECGLSEREAMATINSGIRGGQAAA